MFGPTDQAEDSQLHELLFLFAYGEARGAVPKPQHLGPGLVAAILIELTEIGAVSWRDRLPQVQAVDPFLPPSRTAFLRKPAVHHVLTEVENLTAKTSAAAAGQTRDLALEAHLRKPAEVQRSGNAAAELGAQPRLTARWMREMAREVHDQTEAALSETGTVRRIKRNGLIGSKEVLIVERSMLPAHLQARVLLIAKGMREPDPESAALCGLISALRLEGLIRNYGGSKFASELHAASVKHAPYSADILDELKEALLETQTPLNWYNR